MLSDARFREDVPKDLTAQTATAGDITRMTETQKEGEK